MHRLPDSGQSPETAASLKRPSNEPLVALQRGRPPFPPNGKPLSIVLQPLASTSSPKPRISLVVLGYKGTLECRAQIAALSLQADRLESGDMEILVAGPNQAPTIHARQPEAPPPSDRVRFLRFEGPEKPKELLALMTVREARGEYIFCMNVHDRISGPAFSAVLGIVLSGGDPAYFVPEADVSDVYLPKDANLRCFTTTTVGVLLHFYNLGKCAGLPRFIFRRTDVLNHETDRLLIDHPNVCLQLAIFLALTETPVHVIVAHIFSSGRGMCSASPGPLDIWNRDQLSDLSRADDDPLNALEAIDILQAKDVVPRSTFCSAVVCENGTAYLSVEYTLRRVQEDIGRSAAIPADARRWASKSGLDRLERLLCYAEVRQLEIYRRVRDVVDTLETLKKAEDTSSLRTPSDDAFVRLYQFVGEDQRSKLREAILDNASRVIGELETTSVRPSFDVHFLQQTASYDVFSSATCFFAVARGLSEVRLPILILRDIAPDILVDVDLAALRTRLDLQPHRRTAIIAREL